MGKFNLEDYRHPWETGPHWELKKEFMEKYSHMFSEDRLLCLAQAYSNIVLMQCSYPDPVMRQISLLSEPLQMRKRFQESNTSEAEGSKSQQQKRKKKYAYESSDNPCKLIKFCAGEEDSTFSVPTKSTLLHENILKQSACSPVDCSSSSTSDNLLSVPQQLESNSNLIDKDQNHISGVKSDAGEDPILSTLGLPFIQNFVVEVRKFQSKVMSAIESILSAAQKLKIYSQVCFNINQVPGCPPHAPQFRSEFNINGCVIASEQGSSKKKAKAKCAENALDILIKIASENRSERSFEKSEAANVLSTREQPTDKQCLDSEGSSVNPVVKFPKPYASSDAVMSNMKLLQTFSEILSKSEEFGEFVRIAKSLNVHNYIIFNTSKNSKSLQESEYECQFFLKDILISSGKDAKKKTAKILAVETGFQKLKKLSQYDIVDGELKERQNISTDEPSKSISSDSVLLKHFTLQSPSFILNKKMFDASIRDGFVLLDNLSLQNLSQKNTRAMLSASASFCRKSFEYKYEDILEVNPPLRKASVVIGEEVVSSATASARDQAKIIACDKALDILKKKYYTLKVKSEYNDGYIISRNQVFEGESFSSNALTESNIGCKMLKSMGWTGGGLGAFGIAEPVEAQGNSSFGRGLGYRKENYDLVQFKRRINSMLQDYSKTDTLSDLVFSKEFTKDERKEIHRIAQKYGLHTGSHGINEDRFLTVRHKYTVTQVLLYLAKNGGSNSKFELVDSTNTSFEI